jgi:uncharacterized oxidoreductase
MKLTGNTILITGGASGIGEEMTKQLLKRQNTIIVTGRSQAKLDKIKKQFPEVHTIKSDVSQIGEIQSLFTQVTKDFPNLNILINNAGIMKDINLHDTNDSLEKLTEEIDINLKGPIRMTKVFLPHLKKKSSAAIVNVTSGLAFVPLPSSPVYCSTKAALHSFTESLRVQLSKTNVKVFEVAPPATQTELLGHLDPEDSKGIKIMTVENMVTASLSGIENDKNEIRPGQSNQLKFMSRVAPNFILKQMSKPMERILKETKH